MNSPSPVTEDIAVLPGPSRVQVVSIVGMFVGTIMLLSPVVVVFIGFIGSTFGSSLLPFLLSIALSIALIAGGLALILNGQKRFRRRRQQPNPCVENGAPFSTHD